ncbi:MAG: hypothetical protein ACK5GN_01935 [Pseudomonadota bacterium]|jgi:hypothetical protein
MPAKVQLKLLSNSGELLNVATCSAGKISVLRASTPSDLRPYQRALSGSSGRDNLEILCDGAPFQPDQHTLIGFGEPSPTSGYTVKEFAVSRGVSDLALATQLLSVGLDDVIDKRCSELTADQEARLRLLAATGEPDKVIVLNDPFENVSGKWRERVAELLAEFARSRNALIIIASLTYRPEAWVANDRIDRIEVGQTSQRTIGFGSAGSQSNAPIEDIRNQLRVDPRFAGQITGSNQRSTTAAAAGAITAGIKATDLDPASTLVASQKPWVSVIGKLLFALIGSSVGGWALFTAVSMYNPTGNTPKSAKSPSDARIAANQVPPAAQADLSGKDKSSGVSQAPAATDVRSSLVAPAQVGDSKVSATDSAYLLDSYPAAIKASLLETARGLIDFGGAADKGAAEMPASESAQQRQAPSGNLFSLLEAASGSKNDPQPINPGDSNIIVPAEEQTSEVDSSTISPEEAQREAIRNRFLEAIRASALRRQAEAEEQVAE